VISASHGNIKYAIVTLEQQEHRDKVARNCQLSTTVKFKCPTLEQRKIQQLPTAIIIASNHIGIPNLIYIPFLVQFLLLKILKRCYQPKLTIKIGNK
jgi:hypothetical protein